MARTTRITRLDPRLRKARLVEATLACLQRDGFQGTSIRRICGEAGVSIGLINHHYRSKDELVGEAYRTVTQRIQETLHAAVAASAPAPRARLTAFFSASFSPELLDPSLLQAWLAFWGAAKGSETVGPVHEESYAEYRTTVEGLLGELAAEQGWKQFDARLAAIALSALLDGLWLEYGLNPRTFTPEDGIRIGEAWIDGLVAGAHARFAVQPG